MCYNDTERAAVADDADTVPPDAVLEEVPAVDVPAVEVLPVVVPVDVPPVPDVVPPVAAFSALVRFHSRMASQKRTTANTTPAGMIIFFMLLLILAFEIKEIDD